MESERDLQRYTFKEAKRLNIGAYKMHCEGQAGFPDVLLVYQGEAVFIELKSPSGRGVLSPLQKVTIAALTNKGMKVYVADSAETIDLIIAQLIS